jgi:hypothetical protein
VLLASFRATRLPDVPVGTSAFGTLGGRRLSVPGLQLPLSGDVISGHVEGTVAKRVQRLDLADAALQIAALDP